MNRQFLTKLHLVFAAFMFPAVLMFLITGALYTWGDKGDWHEETVTVPLEQPLTANEGTLKAIALAELARRDLPEPSGTASVSGEGADASLTWIGARSEAEVSATDDPTVAEVTIREASFHRWLVQLHKAKGSTVFKVYATLLAITLFLLVASGLVMGLQVKSMRRLTAISGLAGFAGFVAFVLMG